MLNYVNIVSKLLLLFGIAGLGAVAFGLTPRLGSIPVTLTILVMQIATGAMILYGAKLQRLNKLSLKLFKTFAYSLLLVFIVAAQTLVNIGDIAL